MPSLNNLDDKRNLHFDTFKRATSHDVANKLQTSLSHIAFFPF
jgi:hypothetical protein